MGYIEFNKGDGWKSWNELDKETKFEIELELLNEGAFNHERES